MKYIGKIKIVVAGILASVLLVLNLTPVYAGYYSDTEADHKDISFAEMQANTQYDYDTVAAAIDRLMQAADREGNDEEVKDCYEKMHSLLDEMVTANALLQLEFYTHLDDDSMSERLEKMSAEIVDLGDKANSAISKMVDGWYRYIVENDIGDDAKDFEHYEAMTQEEKDLVAREEALETEYERYSQDPAYTGEERYNYLANLYIELVKVRKEIAKHSDYKSYREYAYEAIYGRDYTVEDADRYHEYVRDYVTDFNNKIVGDILKDMDSYNALWEKECKDLDSIFQVMDKHIGEIHPELKVAYDYFKKNHVYYIEENDTMFEAGYTTKLYSYNTPFIYNALYGNFYDYTDVFHEFGHFNQMFHEKSHAMYTSSSFDVAEIHSQGLEFFFLDWAEECYGQELAGMARLFTTYRMLDNVINGSLQDEFQALVFEMPEDELSPERLASKYQNLMFSYGRNGRDEYGWVDITHNFNSPFYYISYSTSAMGALQIYELSKEDRDKAVDVYMKLTALPGSVGFCEAVEEVGLQNIMQEGVVEKVCQGLNISLREERPKPVIVVPKQEGSPEKQRVFRIAHQILIFLGITVVVLGALSVVLIRKHRFKK